MAESGEIRTGVTEITNEVENWSLDCEVIVAEDETTIQESSYSDIALVRSITQQEVAIEDESSVTNIMEIDVYITLNGTSLFVVESQIVPYDKILNITDYSPATTSETRYASSALATKKIHDYISEIELRVDRLEEYNENNVGGECDHNITIDTEMSDTSKNAVQNRVIKAYVDGKYSELEYLKEMFFWGDEEKSVIGTKYPFYSKSSITAGGKSEGGNSGGGDDDDDGGDTGLDLEQLEEYLTQKEYATRPWVIEQGYVNEKWVTDQDYINKTWLIEQGYVNETWVFDQGFATIDWVEAQKFAYKTDIEELDKKISEIEFDPIAIDDEMSDESENPVQNKVIKEYVDKHPQYEIIDEIDVPDFNDNIVILDNEMSDTSENGVKNRVIKKYVDDHDKELRNDINELMELNDMFYWDDDHAAIGTKYPFFSEGSITAGGKSEGGDNGSFDIGQLEEYLTENGYATQSWVQSQEYAYESDLNELDRRLSDVENRGESINDMFYWEDEEHTIIGTKYPFFSEESITAGGKSEGGSNGGFDIGQLEEYLTENGYATKDWINKQNYALESDLNDLNRRVTDIENGGSSINDMFYWEDEEHTIVGTKYPLFSEQSITAGGKKTGEGEDVQGGLDIDALEDYLSKNKYATQTWVNSKGYATENWVNNKGYATTEALQNSLAEVNARLQELSKLLEWFEYDETAAMIKAKFGLYSVGAITAGKKEEE